MRKTKKEQPVIKVPEEVRDQLQPYAEMFETIVLSIIRDIAQEDITWETGNRLRGRIAVFQHEKGQRQHPVLVYYGLMLCCYYCGKGSLKRRIPKRLVISESVVKARQLIRLAYQHHPYEDLIFMCG